ncbi:hypothetical protein [Massilia sp. S19_KUP03_FR1]|uniref:hypothetical protein n=1 Tax=Massilia sp. S19_KUP03_FR1 TaxID=3025503 RepID=UPI002FCD7173
MFRFTFYVCIRFDAVEDILNPLLARSKEYWGVSRSVTLNLDFFVGENLSFMVHNLREIETAFVEVEKILQRKVFPMLDECNDLPALERLLNNKIIVRPLESEANAGVVAAALCHKNDFTEIVSRHRYAMNGYIEPIRLRFEMVVSHLTKTFF